MENKNIQVLVNDQVDLLHQKFEAIFRYNQKLGLYDFLLSWSERENLGWAKKRPREEEENGGAGGKFEMWMVNSAHEEVQDEDRSGVEDGDGVRTMFTDNNVSISWIYSNTKWRV